MTPQTKIKRAIELLAEAQAELAGETRETRGPNLERVAEFLRAETVAGDRMTAKLCWCRFNATLPSEERNNWNRRALYGQLRALGYRVTPGTNNKWTIHGLALKGSHESTH
jgi:hypothetical protein